MKSVQQAAKVLNLSHGSNFQQSRLRYLQLAKSFHPDSHQVISDEKFKEINAAFDYLKEYFKT